MIECNQGFSGRTIGEYKLHSVGAFHCLYTLSHPRQTPLCVDISASVWWYLYLEPNTNPIVTHTVRAAAAAAVVHSIW